MRILNRILEGNPRRVTIVSSAARWQRRIWLTAVTFIGLSCVSLLLGLFQNVEQNASRDLNGEIAEAEDEADSETSATVAAMRERSSSRKMPEADPGPADENRGPVESPVRSAAFQTTEHATSRGAQLKGTILIDETDSADDSNTPTRP